MAASRLLSFLIVLGGASFIQSAQAETFQEALISAYNSNPGLMAARAQVREIDENYIQARAQGRINANIAGNLGYAITQASGSFVPGLPDQTFTREGSPSAAQLQVIQPLYQGGRVRALKSQAKANILAARQNLRNTEQDLLLSAARAYVDVLRNEEAARIRRNNVSVLARQEMAAKDRFDVGVGTLTDTAQAQSRLAIAEAGAAQAEAELQASRAIYVQLIGHMPVDLQSVPLFELPPTLEAAIARARQNNPGLLAAHFNQEAAKAGIDVAKSGSKPVVSLNGSLGGQRGQINGLPRTDQLAVTAQITVPLYSGGANRSRLRQARHAENRIGFEIRDAERSIDAAIRRLWARLEAAELILKSSLLQAQAAGIAFEGVELEQSVGTRTTLDVLDAEQEVLNSKLAVIDARKDLNVASFELLAIIGVFDAEGIRLPVDNYDPNDNFEHIKSDGLVRITQKYVPEKILSTVKEIGHKN